MIIQTFRRSSKYNFSGKKAVKCRVKFNKYSPAPRLCLFKEFPIIICAHLNMHPHPESEVMVDGSKESIFRRYVNRNRDSACFFNSASFDSVLFRYSFKLVIDVVETKLKYIFHFQTRKPYLHKCFPTHKPGNLTKLFLPSFQTVQ